MKAIAIPSYDLSKLRAYVKDGLADRIEEMLSKERSIGNKTDATRRKLLQKDWQGAHLDRN